uniref:Uncharacterized protein n=1 Tax=viral metagenome TaxID=1070528 RepID=A0A6C0J8V4_9ZZZZ
MYNYSINTTYLDIKDEDQDTQYRKELLEVFMLHEYRHKPIMKTIEFCFKQYGEQHQVKIILTELIKHSTFPFGLDQATAFTILFSFENFYYFHKALKNMERNSTINPELYKNIIENLQKNSL